MKKLLVFCCLFLSACASLEQNVKPVDVENLQLCVIENQAVKNDYLHKLKSALDQEGIKYTVATNTCPLQLEYDASYAWDITIFLESTEIRILRDGEVIGQANYEVPGGRWSLNQEKFKKDEGTIRGLVKELFKSEG
jgi:hypothetical protein